MITISLSTNFNALSDYASKLGCNVFENEPLCSHTSFKTGGSCSLLIEPVKVSQLKPLFEKIDKLSVPYIILGNGTNVLAPDDGLEKAVIKIGDAMAEITLSENGVITCSAGTKLVTLCKFALENSLSGLEFAYGIPGTVGGAVYMNAGAYGGEIKDVLTEITHISPKFKAEIIPPEKAELSYRHSAYKENGCIIAEAKFKLTPANKADVKAAMDDFLSRRKDKQPLEYPSAGSTFKRPEGYFAGALIEQCNLKGKTIGGAQVSEKHAGFVINKGGATSADILSLIEFIQKTVKDETGVTLQPEVIVLR